MTSMKLFKKTLFTMPNFRIDIHVGIIVKHDIRKLISMLDNFTCGIFGVKLQTSYNDIFCMLSTTKYIRIEKSMQEHIIQYL